MDTPLFLKVLKRWWEVMGLGLMLTWVILGVIKKGMVLLIRWSLALDSWLRELMEASL